MVKSSAPLRSRLVDAVVEHARLREGQNHNFWKIFFMACAELWGFRDGNEWHVSHYLFSRVQPS